jgi:hypothetical protein
MSSVCRDIEMDPEPRAWLPETAVAMPGAIFGSGPAAVHALRHKRLRLGLLLGLEKITPSGTSPHRRKQLCRLLRRDPMITELRIGDLAPGPPSER